jgi:uncharacterized protein (DUF2384 family)
MTVTERQRVYELVLAFFDADHDKTRAWMNTPNPLLGGMPPKDLIVVRPGKVLRFVEQSLQENHR